VNGQDWRHRLRHLDWDAIAGVVAAVTGLVLHLLHLVEIDTLVVIMMVLLAVLLLRDLHREDREERTRELLERAADDAAALRKSLAPPDALLVGPRQLREHSSRFAQQARGEMVWFNVCLLMFVPQSLFDVLLRPALENPHVTSIRFVLDPGEQGRWEAEVIPKARACRGHEKLLEPHWVDLDESVSFILADIGAEGRTQAQLSFWGEPFMARTRGQSVPRYIFDVQPHSELIPRLIELEREYRVRR
jgi:hypothetical protein